MRVALHDLWGCGHGPVSRLAPQTRIGAGMAVFGACIIAPATTRAGVALIVSLVALWAGACRTPLRVVGTALLVGCAVLLPYVLLMTILPADAASGVAQGSWSAAFGVFAHGLSTMLVSVTTVSALSASDLREGLLRLPVPRLVAAIVLQIVHQSAALGYETRRIASAMAVRGASGGGTAAWRVLSSLPQVWLPRVLMRSERVAAAMEVRGYCEQDLPSFGSAPLRGGDAVVLALAVVALAGAAAVRWGGLP